MATALESESSHISSIRSKWHSHKESAHFFSRQIHSPTPPTHSLFYSSPRRITNVPPLRWIIWPRRFANQRLPPLLLLRTGHQRNQLLWLLQPTLPRPRRTNPYHPVSLKHHHRQLPPPHDAAAHLPLPVATIDHLGTTTITTSRGVTINTS